MTLRSTPERVNDLEADAFRTGRSLAGLRDEVRGVAADTQLLPALSGKIAVLESEVAGLRHDLAEMRGEIRAGFSAVGAQLDRLIGGSVTGGE